MHSLKKNHLKKNPSKDAVQDSIAMFFFSVHSVQVSAIVYDEAPIDGRPTEQLGAKAVA